MRCTVLRQYPQGWFGRAAWVIGVVYGLVVSSVMAGDPASPRRDTTVAVVERVKGAVVNIHSERLSTNLEDAFRPGLAVPQRINGMGTGIVLDPRGYIVTNFHVVDDVQSLRVRLVDGTNCPARILALDKEHDLALIKIDPPQLLPIIPLGTAQDLMLAEKVIAIGNAYGYEHTVTIGHVSAKNRDVTLNKEISYRSLIQTQTPINPGNSGGPLMNCLGEVVGVNVAIRAGAQNIAFAIPVDTMISRATEMLALRRRAQVHHGLAVMDRWERAGEDQPIRRWVAVQKVESGSLAAQAGLQLGDVLEQIEDITIGTSIDVERSFLDRGPTATALAVRVRRGSGPKPEILTLQLPARPNAVQGSLAGLNGSSRTTAPLPPAEVEVNGTAAQQLGISVFPVQADVVARVNPELRGGLLLQEVRVGSPAARAGLDRGDILIGLHQWETLNTDNLKYVLNHKDRAQFQPIKTFFVRNGQLRETMLALP